MAKQGKGLLTAPPKGSGKTDARRKLEAKNRQANGTGKYAGLNKDQSAMINQRNQGDLALGNQANSMLPGIEQAYSQPFDWSQLPSAPVQGDFNNWRQSQIDSTYNDFSKRLDPQFAQQSEDFEQQMANRGIPMGSELYNQQKQLMTQGQNDARSSALVQAQGLAGQNAGQFFDIGTQARGGALNEGLMQRNMPLSEYQQLMGARSGFDAQNLGYSQTKGLQTQQEANQRWMMQNAPRGGGGGGSDPFMGFGSAEGLWAAQDARARGNQQWEYQNNPQYQQKKGPSYGAQLGGGLLGSAMQGWAGAGFPGIF